MTNNTNPLIEAEMLDTLGNVENHLRFINDYFSAKQSVPYDSDNALILHGLSKTMDMSIAALCYEIKRYQASDES